MNDVINDLDSDLDSNLDIDWFTKIQDINDKYSILEQTDINSNINIYFFYLDKTHTKIISINKDSIKLHKNTLKNKLLINIIDDYLINDTIKYKIDDILKYNDTSTTSQILKNINLDQYKYTYLKSLSSKQDIHFQQTIKGFMHLNSIYVVLIPDTMSKRNNTTKRKNALKRNNKTKRNNL